MTPLPSLRRRLLLPLALIGVLLAGSAILLAHVAFSAHLHDQLLARARQLADSLGDAAETITDLDTLQRLVAAQGAAEGVELLVVIADSDPPRIIAATRLGWIGRSPMAVSELGELLDRHDAFDCHGSHGQALCYSAPQAMVIGSGDGDTGLTPGTVLVRIDRTALENNARHTTLALSASIALATLLLLLCSARLHRRRVFEPLNAIRLALEQRAAGARSTRAPVLYDDEIGHVADCLNGMLDRLDAQDEHLQRLARLYAALSETNQTIVRAREPEKLFSEICRITTDFGQLPLAWIGRVDARREYIVVSACHGPDSDYILAQAPIALDPDRPEGFGPPARALLSGQAQISNDTLTDPRTAPWHARARAFGIASTASFPIRSGGQTIAVLSLYARSAHFFDGDVVRLLTETTEDIGFALDNLLAEQARAEAETALRDSELRYRRLFEANPLPLWVYDRDSQTLLAANTAALETFGYGQDDWRQLTLHQLLPADESQSLAEALEHENADSETVWRLQRRDGSTLFAEVHSYPLGFEGRRARLLLIHDISARREAEAKLEFLANHDALTGLPNRVLLNDRLRQTINIAHRHGTRVGVLFLDLDRFKVVNDSLGHAVGDRLLQHVAQRLRSCLRAGDTVSRLGGDEFVVILNEIGEPEQAGRVAEKILAQIAQPLMLEERELHISLSLGIALFPDDGSDADTLLRHADLAMYLAKEAGRSDYRFFTADLNARALERLSFEGGLRAALEHGEFVLHYQPQVAIADGELIGFEALVRWQHPQLGLVPPNRFIPIAEDSGLIVALGEWVIEAACRQNRDWQRQGLPHVPIAVNLSAVQFRHRALLATVAGALAESGLAADCLELELTESILMQADRVTLDTVSYLKELGVQLSIDDFGTGYSSLGYLKRFPVDKLKIDQSFVRGLDAADDVIVTTIIGLAHNLGLGVIAEGVETAEQARLLLELGCGEAQGYHFGRPLPATEARGVLLHENERRQLSASRLPLTRH